MSVKLRITGQVQGVYFRGWAAEQARALGLTGWVRNRADGSVELLAAGDPEKVERLIALCRDGPPAARVEHVELETVDEPAPTSFRVQATV